MTGPTPRMMTSIADNFVVSFAFLVMLSTYRNRCYCMMKKKNSKETFLLHLYSYRSCLKMMVALMVLLLMKMTMMMIDLQRMAVGRETSHSLLLMWSVVDAVVFDTWKKDFDQTETGAVVAVVGVDRRVVL